MPISAVGGAELSQANAAKVLQALGIVEATSLWTWGALFLAVAATLASILNTYKLTGFIPFDAAAASDSLRLIPGSGSASDDAGASGGSALRGEDDVGESERVEPKAASARRVDVPDSDRRTKGQQLRMEGEEQMESVGSENWDLSDGGVVKLWPQGLYFRGGDLTASQSLLVNDYQRRPVMVISGNGDIEVCDRRAICRSPVMSAYRLSSHKPVSEIGYDGTGKIFFKYGGGSGRDDLLVRDLRMLGPNCDGRASSNSRCDSQWWEDEAVIVPREHGHGKEDEFQIVGYDYSLKFPECSRSLDGINSRSMVFQCLDVVRSISSGLM